MTETINIICPYCNKEGKQRFKVKCERKHEESFYCQDCNKEFKAIVRELISIKPYILSAEISKS